MSDGLGILGLAFRASHLAAGDTAVVEAVREKRARLICTAADAAPKLQEGAVRLEGECNGLYLHTHLTKADMGGALGRGVCSIIAFTDPGLAASFVKALASADPERYGDILAELEDRQKTALKRKAKKRRRFGRNQARGGRMNG